MKAQDREGDWRERERARAREALEHRAKVPEGAALNKGRMPPLLRQKDTGKAADVEEAWEASCLVFSVQQGYLYRRRQSHLLRMRVGGGVGWVEDMVKVCWVRMGIHGCVKQQQN